MAGAAPTPVLPGDLAQALGGMGEWAFVVSDQWVLAIQSLAIVSLMSSVAVLAAVGLIARRHGKYLRRLSLRVSGYVALADLLSAVAQITMLQNDLMMRQSAAGLRFILWLSMSSTLLFVFLTLAIAVQLHLSTLTRVRVAAYMRLERVYVPASVALAAALPAVAVALMQGIFWVPYMHAFSWPADAWARRLVLWLCSYAWIVGTIAYCAAVALCLSLRIAAMWRNSVEVIAEPRMPEKWDWSRLTSASTRASHDTLSESTACDSADALRKDPRTPLAAAATDSSGRVSISGSMGVGAPRRGYLVTVMGSGPVAVRSYVDKARFLRSVQRLACYPLVPIITQLGVVAMNMTSEPSRGLYIYGTAMACLSGLLNLLVFLLNPALPDIWRDAALASLN
ncbi:hypothetical protein H4R26_002350 [Coemansia thaxteri]|uniref:Uncharacterized protein n=1 Tax=Coemansia thaxteri TaxID=2663907 RepID=A0A9W8BEH2_9FUNG|nr:hypothetical protein H4R26_002350 [Coemansia thaxteri]